jgi:hypothetical protein
MPSHGSKPRRDERAQKIQRPLLLIRCVVGNTELFVGAAAGLEL